MRRRRNWDTHLVDLHRQVQGEPFVWGQTDCGSLVYRALVAMYGAEDVPLRDPPPDYGSKEKALRAAAQGGSVESYLRDGGAEEVELPYAQQGDVIIGVDEAGGLPGAAVVISRYYVVANEERGIETRRLRDLREKDPDVIVLRPPVE